MKKTLKSRLSRLEGPCPDDEPAVVMVYDHTENECEEQIADLKRTRPEWADLWFLPIVGHVSKVATITGRELQTILREIDGTSRGIPEANKLLNAPRADQERDPRQN